MQAMRYEINLPADYDMTLIRERVTRTGYLMDGFEDLYFKVFLISEISSGNLTNSYCPLYVWKQTDGMSKFIFDGYFDNILSSFGWQQIEIGITSNILLSKQFTKSKFVTEEASAILPVKSLKQSMPSLSLAENETGKLVIYNPDKWQTVTYTFYETKPNTHEKCLEILHISN